LLLAHEGAAATGERKGKSAGCKESGEQDAAVRALGDFAQHAQRLIRHHSMSLFMCDRPRKIKWQKV
jgi:hypothetical protein